MKIKKKIIIYVFIFILGFFLGNLRMGLKVMRMFHFPFVEIVNNKLNINLPY